ncbi:MAG: DUF188 domain-containing protein [Oscillospiraceae bacterium]
MTILIDADACPVKELAVREAKMRDVPVVMLCDTSHELHSDYAQIIVVDKGRDSADIRLANMVKKGDIVITQDYGVAALVLGKGGYALGNSGTEYTNDNIEAMLYTRYNAQKERKQGRYTHNLKRQKTDDEAFLKAYLSIFKRCEI